MDKEQAAIPNVQMDNSKEDIQTPTFNENENIILNDNIDQPAGVINKPVTITSSNDIDSNSDKNNNNEAELNPQKINLVLEYLKSPFFKLGRLVQNLISKISDKIQVQSSYKYFLIFLAIGLLFFFFSLLCIPFIIFNPGKFLRLLSLGNIFIMFSFFYYYGSKDFFAFLVDENRTCIVFAHLSGMFFSLFISIFIGGYFLQLLLDFVLGITTVMFILTLLPGGKGGISAIKNMILGPGLFLWNSVKGKIFGDNNNGSVLP